MSASSAEEGDPRTEDPRREDTGTETEELRGGLETESHDENTAVLAATPGASLPEPQLLKRRAAPPKKRPPKRPRTAESVSRLEEPATLQHHDSDAVIRKKYEQYTAAAKYNFNSEEVFCVCREPDRGEMMIMCDGCSDWFHLRCLGYDATRIHEELIHKFFCIFCEWKGLGETLWKRVCRLPGCTNPINTEGGAASKYCGDEHGMEFMRRHVIGRLRSGPVDLHHPLVLTPGEIRRVMGRVGSVEELQQLGGEFPALSSELHLPLWLAAKMDGARQRLAALQAESGHLTQRQLFLSHVREKVKFASEQVTVRVQGAGGGDVASARKGKSKGKTRTSKVDICGFDMRLHGTEMPLLDQERVFRDAAWANELYAAYTAGAPETDEEYPAPVEFDHMCVSDRRRCLRHSGWAAMCQDEVLASQRANERSVEELEQLKREWMHKHAVDVYEGRVITATATPVATETATPVAAEAATTLSS